MEVLMIHSNVRGSKRMKEVDLEGIFNKPLLRLMDHLFGVCISLGTNPLIISQLLNIPYDNMNDEFIIGMPDKYSKT